MGTGGAGIRRSWLHVQQHLSAATVPPGSQPTTHTHTHHKHTPQAPTRKVGLVQLRQVGIGGAGRRGGDVADLRLAQLAHVAALDLQRWRMGARAGWGESRQPCHPAAAHQVSEITWHCINPLLACCAGPQLLQPAQRANNSMGNPKPSPHYKREAGKCAPAPTS